MITINHISKTYHPKGGAPVPALQDLSLHVDKGEFVAITGVSGSGKSTLLHVIGGMDKIDEGEILVDNEDITKYSSKKLARYRNEKIGFVLQDFGLIPYRTVLENVSVPLYIHQKKPGNITGQAIDILKEMGISDLRKRRVSQLSGGQKQRVAIARAMINSPEILLADEPTGALDTKTKKEIMDVFMDLNKKGTTLIMVTHDPEVSGFAHRVVKISDGKIEDSSSIGKDEKHEDPIHD